MKKEGMKSNTALDMCWVFLLLSTGTITYILYAQFFSSGWTFDDTRILKGLGDVTDIRSAINYIQAEINISPLNRPLSVASFLLNIGDWPANINGFRHINTLIHIFNGLLLALFSLRLAQIIPSLKNKAIGFAVTLSMLWMLHPFLASTSYHVIQRMVLLAATFSLFGSILYLYGRSLLEKLPGKAYLWMTCGLVVSGGIGTLAKETAALTPLLIGVMEYTVLSYYVPVKDRCWGIWRTVFFGLPALALALYGMYFILFGITPGYHSRPFTFSERLFSESLILLKYVKQIVVPDISLMGPFQDDLSFIHGMELITLASLIIWVGLVSMAIYLRKRIPLFSFAVLFFLTGHLLESTVFPLELYFEHRNYLPSLGVLGGAVALTWCTRHLWPKVMLMIYTALMGLLLWQTTTLWGDEYESSHRWVNAHQTSFRATLNLVNYYQKLGQTEAAADVLYQGYQRIPMDGWLSVTILSSQCFRTDQDKFIFAIEEVISKAPNLNFNFDTTTVLHGIIDMQNQGKCKQFNVRQVVDFTDGLLGNSKYSSKAQKSALLFAKARAMDITGEYQSALKHKIEAFRTLPTLIVAKIIYNSFVKIEKYEEANIFLNEVRQRLPEFANDYDSWERNSF